jgi:hypothetical protein
MSRTVTADFLDALVFQAADEDFTVLATISHPTISEPIRLVCDTVDIVSNGNTFIGFPFEFTLPSDNEAPPRGRIRIQNVDKRLGQVILSLETAVNLQLDVILRSDPDTLQVSYKRLKIRNITGDAVAIEGEIGVQDYTTLQWPRSRAIKSVLPGLFA